MLRVTSKLQNIEINMSGLENTNTYEVPGPPRTRIYLSGATLMSISVNGQHFPAASIIQQPARIAEPTCQLLSAAEAPPSSAGSSSTSTADQAINDRPKLQAVRRLSRAATHPPIKQPGATDVLGSKKQKDGVLNTIQNELKKLQETILAGFENMNQQIGTLKAKIETILTCQICCDKPIQVCFIPCGHLICKTCSINVISPAPAEGSCPYCNTEIERIQRVYFP